MKCTCKEDVEKELLESVKKTNPDFENVSARLDGYGFFLEGNAMKQKPKSTARIQYTYKLKNGNSRHKTESISISVSFCPFCGISLNDDK